MDLTDVIKVRIENMRKLYELTGGVAHDGEKGAFREFFVSELIKAILPHHFGVGSGVAVGRDGRQSPQLDVIIFDRRRVPPILQVGERGLYPVDTVLAVCEVKSKLRAADYKQAGLAARHFHPAHPECLRFAHSPAGITHPLYSLFAYTSGGGKKDEPTRLKKQLPNRKDRDTIRLIAVLDKGLWLWNGKTYQAEPDPRRVGEMFVLHLLNRLEESAEKRARSGSRTGCTSPPTPFAPRP